MAIKKVILLFKKHMWRNGLLQEEGDRCTICETSLTLAKHEFAQARQYSTIHLFLYFEKKASMPFYVR